MDKTNNNYAFEDNQMRERIIKLIHREGLSQREFANKIGRRPPNLSKILTGELKVPRNLANEILNAYPELGRDWLMFGEGSMYNEKNDAVVQSISTRPRLPKNISGGDIEEYYKGSKRSKCQEKPIITQFSDYDFSIILKNDRMLPTYRPSDELFFKASEIYEWGNDYLLDTKEGPKFKKVYPHTNNKGQECFRCVSYNKEKYPDFIIPRDIVLGHYRLVGVLRIL